MNKYSIKHTDKTINIYNKLLFLSRILAKVSINCPIKIKKEAMSQNFASIIHITDREFSWFMIILSTKTYIKLTKVLSYSVTVCLVPFIYFKSSWMPLRQNCIIIKCQKLSQYTSYLEVNKLIAILKAYEVAYHLNMKHWNMD